MRVTTPTTMQRRSRISNVTAQQPTTLTDTSPASRYETLSTPNQPHIGARRQILQNCRRHASLPLRAGHALPADNKGGNMASTHLGRQETCPALRFPASKRTSHTVRPTIRQIRGSSWRIRNTITANLNTTQHTISTSLRPLSRECSPR
jgi:hypothetical protein